MESSQNDQVSEYYFYVMSASEAMLDLYMVRSFFIKECTGGFVMPLRNNKTLLSIHLLIAARN